MQLLVIGSVAFDAIETPFGKTDKIIGGAASYISLTSSYFTKPVNLVAVVGDDFPQQYIDTLSNHGVNTDALQIKKGEKSFFWSGKYHNDMNSRDTLVTELNVLEHFNPVVPDNYQNCEILMLGNLSPSVQNQVLNNLHNRPKFIALDTMNFWMDISHSELLDVIKKIDLLLINEEEARQLSGEYSLISASKKIRTMGPKHLIIKKGEHGSILFFNDDIFICPALLLEHVFDPTGAGDSFAGGFIGYLSQCDNINFQNVKNAVLFGTAMASFCVEKFGTEGIQGLEKSKIEERVQEIKALMV